MPRSSTRSSRSSAPESAASLWSDSNTSCPASAKTRPISAPISPAPTTPIFSFMELSLVDRGSSAERAGQIPGQLGQGSRQPSLLDGVGAGGGAVDRPFGDPLQDRGDAEQAVDHVEFPLRHR